MLSYLKEDQGDQNNQIQSNENLAEGDQSQAKQEYLMPSNNTALAKQGTMILMLLFAVGAGSVFLMVKKVVPAQAQAADTTQQTQIETAIAKLSGIKNNMNGKLDKIAEKIYSLSNVNQLATNDLVKNPFIHSSASSIGAADAQLTEQEHTKTVNYKLWSILQSDQGTCCMINNKLLYEGDKIDNMTVIKIGKKTVQLASEDETIVLRISQ